MEQPGPDRHPIDLTTDLQLAGADNLQIALANGLRRRGVFGGGGRYNVSLAHGPAEVDLLIDAVEDVLDRDLAATAS